MTGSAEFLSSDRRGNRTTIDKSKVVICEGIEEQLLFPRLLPMLGAEALKNELQFFNCGGKSNLESYIQKELKLLPGYASVTSIGIIIDASGNPEGFAKSLQKAQNALRLIGFPEPPTAASVINYEGYKSAIWVMPDNKSPGELENLCMSALSGHCLMPCIAGFQDCAKSQGHGIPKSVKSHLYTLLAWTDPPGRRLADMDDHFLRSWDLDIFRPMLELFLKVL